MHWKQIAFYAIATAVAVLVVTPISEAVFQKVSGGKSIENVLSMGKAA